MFEKYLLEFKLLYKFKKKNNKQKAIIVTMTMVTNNNNGSNHYQDIGKQIAKAKPTIITMIAIIGKLS